MDPVCATCRMPLAPGAGRCANCGTTTAKGTGTQPIGSPPLTALAPQPSAPLVAPSGQQRVCSTCGYIAASERDRCGHCETPYGAAALLVPLLAEQRFWVAVETTFQCRACGHASPLNHLDVDGAVLCLHCGIEQRFDANQWWGALAHAHAVGDLAGPHAEGRFPNPQVSVRRHNPHVEIGRSRVSAPNDQGAGQSTPPSALRLSAAPGHPLCPRCRAPLELISAQTPELEVRCTNPACAEHSVHVLPPKVALHVPQIVGVLGKEHIKNQKDVTLESDASGLVLVKCPQCTAPVDVSSHSTVVQCRYCQATSRVSHQLLRQMGFEKPKLESWWLLFQGPSKLRSKLERNERRAQPRPAARVEAPLHGDAEVSTRRSRKSQAARFVLALSVFGGLAVATAVATFVLTSGAPDATPLAALPQSEAANVNEQTELGAQPPTALVPAPPLPAPSEALKPGPSFVAEWPAHVASTRGSSVKRGTACNVRAKVVDGSLDWVKVDCGNATLYDRRTPLNGMSMSSSELFEVPDSRATSWRYRLKYADTGARRGRSQITLNSFNAQGVVFSEDDPSFRVELRLSAESVAREGEALFDTPRNSKPLLAKLKVKQLSGPAPIPQTALCELSATFTMGSSEGPQCKTRLACGAITPYGKGESGYGQCRLKDGAVVAFSDPTPSFRDADPVFEFDLTAPRISLSDTPDTEPYTVEFETR
jgi:hypothetical protein